MADDRRANPTMGLFEWGLLFVLSVLWGATFFFVEVALVDFGPLTIVAGRVGLAAAVLVWVTLGYNLYGFSMVY